MSQTNNIQQLKSPEGKRVTQYGGKQYKDLLDTTESPGALLTQTGKVWIDIGEKVILELGVER